MKVTKNPMINLNKLGGRVYVGRPNGELARKFFHVEEFENGDQFPITVEFPKDAKTLTSSFFLGLFGDSVRKAGSRKGFLETFAFTANEDIMEEIDEGIIEALSAS